jgi:serine/threonine-protein kinase HipA
LLTVEQAGRNVELCTFQYGRRYLERSDALPIDPFRLPLDATRFTASDIFGAIRDAGPDAWGRRVLERRYGDQTDQRYGELPELDYLLLSSDLRVGALGFHTEIENYPIQPPPSVQQLPDLLSAADAVIDGTALSTDLLAALHRGGSSIGGARPKAVVELDDALWVGKFPHRDDAFDYPRVEAATLALARTCGIDVPETRLHQIDRRAVLLTRRFDRQHTVSGYLRRHYVSARTVLGLGSSMERGSYLELADELRRWCAEPGTNQKKLFRRMLFNIACGNTDDHPRNHALILSRQGYELSPVFDVVPIPQQLPSRHQAMIVGDAGTEATLANALSGVERFGLDVDTAKKMARDMRSRFARVADHLAENGVEVDTVPAVIACCDANRLTEK